MRRSSCSSTRQRRPHARGDLHLGGHEDRCALAALRQGQSGAASEVQALRCGLDAVAWAGQGAAQCSKLLNIPADQAPEEDGLLPFDLAHAHALYQALFAGAEDLIKGKSLIVVPSGALTRSPFQVLVTALPDNVPSGEQRREAGLLGAQIQKNLTAEERQSLNLSAGRGVRIVKPAPGGAAEAAGLQPDEYSAVNGRRRFRYRAEGG